MAKRKSSKGRASGAKSPHVRATAIASKFRAHMGNVSSLLSMFVLVNFEAGKLSPAVLRNWFEIIKKDADGALDAGAALIDLVRKYEGRAGE